MYCSVRWGTEPVADQSDTLRSNGYGRLGFALPRGLQVPIANRPLSTRIQNKEMKMEWDIIEGNWRQFKGRVKEQWGNLSDDHFESIAGKRDQLIGKIQENYGIGRIEADAQVSAWEDQHHDFIAETAAAIRALPKSLRGSTE
jgi:uncharacterized protein YjbJ (UPF0337 family)